MSRATAAKIVRLFGGKFTEKGDFVPIEGEVPRRYRCSCNPNGFVAGQAINHYKFCPFHQRNIETFLGEESRVVLVIVAFLVGLLFILGFSAFSISLVRFIESKPYYLLTDYPYHWKAHLHLPSCYVVDDRGGICSYGHAL